MVTHKEVRRRQSQQAAKRRKDSTGCCAMAAAGRATRRGKLRLARRYAVMSVRLIAGRVA